MRVAVENKGNYRYYVILKFLPVKAKNIFLLNKAVYVHYIHKA